MIRPQDRNTVGGMGGSTTQVRPLAEGENLLSSLCGTNYDVSQGFL